MRTEQKEQKRARPKLPELSPDKSIAPLDSPGMPLPGPDFIEMARLLGDEETEITGKNAKDMQLSRIGETLHELYRQAVYSDGRFSSRISRKPGQYVTLRTITGHKWGGPVTGPVPSDAMVIGKMLGEEEVAARRNLVGKSGEYFYELSLQFAPQAEVDDWYVTNVMKTSHPDGYGNTNMRASWVKEWMPVLQQEMRVVRPKFILCLGADASKALLGKQATIKHMAGRVKEYQIPIGYKTTQTPPADGEPGEGHEVVEIEYHTALVMSITHPAAVLASPEQEEALKDDIARWVQLTRGERWDLEEDGLDHRVIDSLEELLDLEVEIDADIEGNLLGLDAEWHGQHPQNTGSYLRSVQLSWRHKTAAAIKLRDGEGNAVFNDEDMVQVQDWWRRVTEGRQLCGHFFDADMEFLDAFGFRTSDRYQVPDNWLEYMEAAIAGKPCAFDTGYAAHALNETEEFSLTQQSLRYTGAPRYDVGLSEWKKSYLSKHNMKDADLEGFGPCPDEILFGQPVGDGHHKNNYAAYDADIARRLCVRRKKQLCKDAFGNNCWEAFWMGMRAMPVILEINTKGILVDRARIDELTETYMQARSEMRQKIRDWARWPDMNLDSVFQVREFLFGEKYNGKPYEDTPVRLRPRGARSLRVDPVLSTDKRPMPWDEVVSKGLEREKNASTDKTSLSLLAQDNQEVVRQHPKTGKIYNLDFSEQINWIRDYRFIGQVLKSNLRPPLTEIDEETQEEVFQTVTIAGKEFHVYAGGIPSAICSDGRVRTHIYPTKETARWSSARPPLQNFSKRREQDYKRILGERYKHKLRSILIPTPGRVLVEADYVGAELFGMAVQSGDARMIEHARRNQLAEDDPDFYDIHSNVARLAFGLECEPTKQGLKAVGKSHLRIVAKSVNCC